MTTANADYNPHELIGAPVVITGGSLIGEKGVIEAYEPLMDVFLVHLASDVHMYTFQGMFEVLDEDEEEITGDMPEVPRQGMTSQQLADYVSDFIIHCTTRVNGVGEEQYSEGTHQKFEAMAIDDLFEWAEEEVQDIAVYAAMLHIRLRRAREAFKGLV